MSDQNVVNNDAANWVSESVAMEERYKAIEKHHGLARCAKDLHKRLSKEDIKAIHQLAVDGKPKNMLALCKLGCADSLVNKIFKKHGLEPIVSRSGGSLSERIKRAQGKVVKAQKELDVLLKESAEERQKMRADLVAQLAELDEQDNMADAV